MEVSLDLIQNIFRRPAQQDRACLGILALCQEGEVFITDLRNLEEPTMGTDVGGCCGENGVDDCCTSCTSNAVVVRLADTANSSDIVFDEEMLCEIYVDILVPMTQNQPN